MKIRILVSGLALLIIGYILFVLGADASDRPEGASYLGVTVDMGTLFLLNFLGSFIILLGILVTIFGALRRSKKKDKN